MNRGYLELGEYGLPSLSFVVPANRIVHSRDQEEADGREVVAVVVRIVRQPLSEGQCDVVCSGQTHEQEEAEVTRGY